MYIIGFFSVTSKFHYIFYFKLLFFRVYALDVDLFRVTYCKNIISNFLYFGKNIGKLMLVTQVKVFVENS